jgi:hypothetical protein
MERAFFGRPDLESGEFYVQNVCREIPYNFVIEEFSIWRRLRPVTWPSSKKSSGTDFWKVPFDSNKVSTCILGNSYTSKCKTRTFCTFATISKLVQINHKSVTKCRQNIGKWCKNKHETSKIIDTFETYHSHMLESYKVANSLYDHLVFDFWCHLMLLLMSLCMIMAVIALLVGRS